MHIEWSPHIETPPIIGGDFNKHIYGRSNNRAFRVFFIDFKRVNYNTEGFLYDVIYN
jgi:hypothetical protein